MPEGARSSSSSAGSILPPPGVKIDTRKRARDFPIEVLSAPIEITRSADEKAIHQFRAETARVQAAVAKGESIKKLRQERRDLIEEKNSADDFDRASIASRIEVLEVEITELSKAAAPPRAMPTVTAPAAPPRTTSSEEGEGDSDASDSNDDDEGSD